MAGPSTSSTTNSINTAPSNLSTSQQIPVNQTVSEREYQKMLSAMRDVYNNGPVRSVNPNAASPPIYLSKGKESLVVIKQNKGSEATTSSNTDEVGKISVELVFKQILLMFLCDMIYCLG